MVKINKHLWFYVLLAGLLVMILLRYAFQINIPRSVLTLVVLVMALMGDKNEILAIFACCIPLHNAIDFYSTVAVCAAIYALKNHRVFNVNMTTVVFMIAVIYELMHCLSGGFSPKLLLVDFSAFFVLAVVVGMRYKEIDYAFLVRTMAICCAAMGMMLLLNAIIHANGDIAYAFSNLQRLGSALEDNAMVGGDINPNSLGSINLLAVTGLMQLSLQGKQNKKDIYLIVFLLLFGTLTLSRTFLVCTFIMMLLWIAGQKGSFKKKAKAMGIVLLIVAMLVLLMVLVFPQALENFIDRFDTDDITTGRDSLMTDYHRFIFDNPFVFWFGVGMNNFVYKTVITYKASFNVPHNGIQEIMVAWGIWGVVIFAIFLVQMIKESDKFNQNKSIINYIPLVIILTKSMSGQLLTSGYTVLALSFAYLSLCQSFNRQEKPE